MEIATPQQRLLELAVARKVSLAELSRLINRNSSYLQQFVRKGSPRKLEESDRRVLARFLGVEQAQLGGPAGDILALNGKNTLGEWFDVPRLELGVSAGPGALGTGEDAIGVIRFSRQWLRGSGFDPAMLSAVAVIGDSMEPTLRDGDEILVDRSPRPLRDGIHVVRIDAALLVKRLDVGLSDRLKLISDNHAYQPIEVARADADIVGRVVWKSGRL